MSPFGDTSCEVNKTSNAFSCLRLETLAAKLVRLRPDFDLSTQGIRPIPEPESYAMLLAGLGLMGAVVRRRDVNRNV